MKKAFRAWFLALGLMASLFGTGSPAFAQSEEGPREGSGWTSWFYEDSDEDTEKNLEEWQQTFSMPSACWGCTLYANMADVTMEVGQKGEDMFKSGAIRAISAFMGLWVVWQLYLLLSPSFANGPAQSIDTIFQRIVLMIILLTILHAGTFSTFMGPGGYVTQAMNGVMDVSSRLVDGPGGCSSGGGNEYAQSGSALICKMHIQMGRGMGLGAWLIDDAEMNILPGGNFEPLQLIGGLIIMLAFGLMMIMLPFRLFDAMIRLGVTAVILPVAVLAYQFKPTRGFTKQAATSVLAAALTFLFTSIAVGISVALLSRVTQPVLDNLSAESVDSFFGPLDGASFMVLIATACGMAAFIKQAGSIATEFAGFQGSMGNVGGAGAGTLAAGAATAALGTGYAGKKLLTGTGSALKGVGSAGMKVGTAAMAAKRAAGTADLGGR